MIVNERQYKTTKRWIRDFQQGIAEMENDPAQRDGVHPLLYKARLDASRSKLEDLEREVREFEALRGGKLHELPVESLSDLPQGLILARVARGMTQKDLAESLGLKEQQIQRYEATSYSGASIKRVMEVAAHLGIVLRGTIKLDPHRTPAVAA